MKCMHPLMKEPGCKAVEENQIGEPADDKATEVAGDSQRKQRERAPLLYVRGNHWSPGVYGLLRLLRLPLEVAWERSFIALPTF